MPVTQKWGQMTGLSSHLKRLAIGALTHCGVHLMCAHFDLVQRTVVLLLAVVRALLHAAFN